MSAYIKGWKRSRSKPLYEDSPRFAVFQCDRTAISPLFACRPGTTGASKPFSRRSNIFGDSSVVTHTALNFCGPIAQAAQEPRLPFAAALRLGSRPSLDEGPWGRMYALFGSNGRVVLVERPASPCSNRLSAACMGYRFAASLVTTGEKSPAWQRLASLWEVVVARTRAGRESVSSYVQQKLSHLPSWGPRVSILLVKNQPTLPSQGRT